MVNLDDNTHVTLSEEMITIMNEVVDTELNQPNSFLNTLDKWNRSYLRTQIPFSTENSDQKYQFNVLSRIGLLLLR